MPKTKIQGDMAVVGLVVCGKAVGLYAAGIDCGRSERCAYRTGERKGVGLRVILLGRMALAGVFCALVVRLWLGFCRGSGVAGRVAREAADLLCVNHWSRSPGTAMRAGLRELREHTSPPKYHIESPMQQNRPIVTAVESYNEAARAVDGTHATSRSND